MFFPFLFTKNVFTIYKTKTFFFTKTKKLGFLKRNILKIMEAP